MEIITKLYLYLITLLSNIAKKKKYNCIDLAKTLIGKKEYWWDGVHTTPTGSQEIVKIIYPKLLEFLK